jgi:hypothetical protein
MPSVNPASPLGHLAISERVTLFPPLIPGGWGPFKAEVFFGRFPNLHFLNTPARNPRPRHPPPSLAWLRQSENKCYSRGPQ